MGTIATFMALLHDPADDLIRPEPELKGWRE